MLKNKKKKIIAKKSDFLKFYAANVKNLLLKNKLIIFNNFTTTDIKNNEINKILNSKLINTGIVQGLKVNFPIKGLTKIISFNDITQFNNINTLILNNPLLKILFVKISNKLYNIDKFLNSSIHKNSKPSFLEELNINNSKNLLFFNLKFFNLVNSFYFLLINKKWFQ